MHPNMHHFITVSPDYESMVFIDMPGVLLHSYGDNLTLTWAPSNVLPTEIASPSDYRVIIEVYVHDFREGWSWYQVLTIAENSGAIHNISSLSPGPYPDFLVPMAFRVSVKDSVNLPGYIRPLVQNGKIGIWSPIAYKVTNSTYASYAQQFCRNWVGQQSVSGRDLLQRTVPCPCRAEQARIGNSMFLEQRSPTAVQLSHFLYPGAATCFLSTTTG